MPTHGSARAILLVLALGMGPASLAAAQAIVFHSAGDEGLRPIPVPVVPVTSLHVLNLYVEGVGPESSSGTICEDANGAELCAVDFVIEGRDGVELSAFLPESGVVYDLDPPADRLRLNHIEATSGITSPVRIGSLQIDTTQAPVGSGLVVLSEGQAIDAGLETIGILPVTLAAVPEPRASMGLALSILLMALVQPRVARTP